MKKIIKNIFTKFGFELKKISKTGPNPVHVWETDMVFVNLYDSIKDHTLVDKVRCFMLYQFLKGVLFLEGDIAEVGVYRGGTAKFLGNIVQQTETQKNIYLFDTFDGMPNTSEKKDLHKKGDFSDTSLEEVSNYLSINNVFLHKGLSPDTATSIKDKKFIFVHVDVDIYQSVFDCCQFFYPRMVGGGVIIFDDYGFISCPGARDAVDEFFKDKKESPIYLQSGQCIFIKS